MAYTTKDESSTQPWYSLSSTESLSRLHTQRDGLTNAQVRERQERQKNVLPSPPTPSIVTLFARQFHSPLIFLLVLASGVVFLLGDTTDSILILGVLIFNACIGTFQEGKAQESLRKLQDFTKTTAVVLRNGESQTISSEEVVVGDMLLLEEGEKIAADARIIESTSLMVNEASLTGESYPVHKDAQQLPQAAQQLAISAQRNMLYSGTYVTSGRGQAVVVAIGIDTVIGMIAQDIVRVDTDVPLKKKIAQLSQRIIVVLVCFTLVFALISLLRGVPLSMIVFNVVSLNVSLIPEGLPVVLTLTLAMSVLRMSKHNALVKKLQAVEALGQASLIAVDKTGTITLGELSVEHIWTRDNHLFTLTGQGYNPKGQLFSNDTIVHPENYPLLHTLGSILASATHARSSWNEKTERWSVHGDPTDAALAIAGQKITPRIKPPKLIEQDPFEYVRKYSLHLLSHNGSFLTVAIGAPESVFALCKKPLPSAVHTQLRTWTQQGLRVIAVALKESKTHTKLASHGLLQLHALIAMRDTIHPEAKESIEKITKAGIRVVMITGDHKETAVSIASEVGIFHEGDQVLTGEELENLADATLTKQLVNTTVYARVSPSHKLRLIESYRNSGETVAMTGDGVNDASSLVAADLGVGMGQRGTDVAKEAADIILLDDNLHSITYAIREGRGLYITIKKVILYLFSTGVGEALTISAALLLGLPTPLLPAQILWLNFVTDVFLDVGLAMEPREHGLLERPWKGTDQALVDNGMLVRMGIVGFTMMVGTLLLFVQYIPMGMTKAITIALTTLAAFQWFNAWNCRSNKSLFSLSPISNLPLIVATVIVVLLHIAALSVPFLQKLLSTTPLTGQEWAICIGMGSTILVVEEVRKLIASRLLRGK